MNGPLSNVSIQRFSVVTCIYWNSSTFFFFLRMQQLFNAAQRCVLRHNIYHSGYISLPAAQMQSQMCHCEHAVFSLLKSWLVFSCLLSSRKFDKTFQPVFWGSSIEREGRVCSEQTQISTSVLQLAVWPNRCHFWAIVVFYSGQVCYLHFETFGDADAICKLQGES